MTAWACGRPPSAARPGSGSRACRWYASGTALDEELVDVLGDVGREADAHRPRALRPSRLTESQETGSLGPAEVQGQPWRSRGRRAPGRSRRIPPCWRSSLRPRTRAEGASAPRPRSRGCQRPGDAAAPRQGRPPLAGGHPPGRGTACAPAGRHLRRGRSSRRSRQRPDAGWAPSPEPRRAVAGPWPRGPSG